MLHFRLPKQNRSIGAWKNSTTFFSLAFFGVERSSFHCCASIRVKFHVIRVNFTWLRMKTYCNACFFYLSIKLRFILIWNWHAATFFSSSYESRSRRHHQIGLCIDRIKTTTFSTKWTQFFWERGTAIDVFFGIRMFTIIKLCGVWAINRFLSLKFLFWLNCN